jgi:hypothetical protein
MGVANERVMAQRAHAKTVEVRASHFVMISPPRAVVRLIESAGTAWTGHKWPDTERRSRARRRRVADAAVHAPPRALDLQVDGERRGGIEYSVRALGSVAKRAPQ